MLRAEVGVGEHALVGRRGRVGVQDLQQFGGPGEVGQPLPGLGRLGRDVDRGGVDGVQLREHPSEVGRGARGRGAAQQRAARQQRVGEHAPRRVGEPRRRHRDREAPGEEPQQPRLPGDLGAGVGRGDAHDEIAHPERLVVEPAAEVGPGAAVLGRVLGDRRDRPFPRVR